MDFESIQNIDTRIREMLGQDPSLTDFDELAKWLNHLKSSASRGTDPTIKSNALAIMHIAMRSKHADELRPQVAELEDAMFPESASEPDPPDLVQAIESLGASPLILRFIPTDARKHVWEQLIGSTRKEGLGVLLDSALEALDRELNALYAEEFESSFASSAHGKGSGPDDKRSASHRSDAGHERVSRSAIGKMLPSVVTKLMCVFSMLDAIPDDLESITYPCAFLHYLQPEHWKTFKKQVKRRKFRVIPSL